MASILRDRKSRRVTPPSNSSYMNNDQFANYLAELRSNRTARPGGARPQPASFRPSTERSSTDPSSLATAPNRPSSILGSPRYSFQTLSIRGGSVSSRVSLPASVGHEGPVEVPAPLKPSDVVPTATYMERGQRWMEREEASALRDAMEVMEIQDKGDVGTQVDETRLHNAALDEAAELVWQHQHPGSIPDQNGPYRYKPHLQRNSYAHARTASVSSGPGVLLGSRSVSGSSSGSGSSSDGQSRRSRSSLEPRLSVDGGVKTSDGTRTYSNSYSERRRRNSNRRNVSGEVESSFSGDQIWEEPETTSRAGSFPPGRGASPEKLSHKPRNPTNKVRFEPIGEQSTPIKRPNRFEIQHNPPSQSRNAGYVSNTGSQILPSASEDVAMKGGLEIRGDDIRAATSRSLRDRSPKLPEPTAVSNSPGRPIVSFNTNWNPPKESTDINPGRPNPTTSSFSTGPATKRQPMVIPTINVPEENPPRTRQSNNRNVPTISIGEPGNSPAPSSVSTAIPTIAFDGVPEGDVSVPTVAVTADGGSGSSRPLPNPGAKPVPRPRHTQVPRGHWSAAPGAQPRGTAVCHECGFPIEGRFVSLRGCTERFHPTCFTCFTCGTGLEAMEISPEPEKVRQERLDRIRRRATGEVLDELPGSTMAEDGDERIRFFCHLDWHEFFAPRCKHCTTPIMGDHIVALGQHWHYGHFFCAECGDPFQQGMTHIEKDGYAWCINCQTKRTERRAPKCKKCRTAVIGEYIQALDGEWHDHCFRCAECQGGFDDGQIFPKESAGGTIVLCTGCRAKELKR